MDDPTASTPSKPGALTPALIALVLPLAAFALAWLIAGKFPLAVPTREWGIWITIGPLIGIAGFAGFVLGFKAFARGGQRALTAVGFILNTLALCIAWAGLFS